MTKCLKIKIDGSIDKLYIQDIQIMGEDSYRVVEIYEIDDNKCFYFMSKSGSEDFNKFEFLRCNFMGEVYVTLYDEILNEFYDLDKEYFLRKYYETDNLDDFLLDDENSENNDEYDFNDEFLIED